jgi:hypothetical protein
MKNNKDILKSLNDMMLHQIKRDQLRKQRFELAIKLFKDATKHP